MRDLNQTTLHIFDNKEIFGGKFMDFIEVKIRNFAKYIKRGDIKTPNWFAMDHNILLHPDFFNIAGDEFKAFVWILGVAAHLNTDTIRVYPEVCASQIRISQKTVRSSIEKLSGKRWDVTAPLRVCTGNSEPTCTTGERREGERREEKGSGGTILTAAAVPTKSRLVEIWNEHRGDLPAVQTITAERAKRIAKLWPKLTENEWTAVVQKIAKSDFCNGLTENGDWKASFDWLIGEKKKIPNYLKVSEGNYDNREKRSSKRDDWNDRAHKVLHALKLPAGDERAKYLGDDLLRRVRAIGGMSRVGAMPANDFTVKTLAGMLKAAEVAS